MSNFQSRTLCSSRAPNQKATIAPQTAQSGSGTEASALMTIAKPGGSTQAQPSRRIMPNVINGLGRRFRPSTKLSQGVRWVLATNSPANCCMSAICSAES